MTDNLTFNAEQVTAQKQDWMLKEIWEQPEVMQRCLLDKLYLPSQYSAEVEQFSIVACGSSRHAGLVGKYWIEQLAKTRTIVESAFEWAYAIPPLTANTLVLAVSQSGETADVLVGLEMDKQRQECELSPKSCRILGITNKAESSLARLADYTINTPAGVEKAIAATKSFTAQLMVFCRLALYLATEKQTLSADRLGQINAQLQQLPQKMQECLLIENAAKLLAEKLKHTKGFFFLGSGINYPIALEGALKLKETTYIYAEGFSAAEFRHGPIAIVEEGVPVIVIAIPGSPTYEKALATAQEVKSRGAYLIGVTSATDPEVEKLFDYCLPIPEIDSLLSPFLTVIPLQLLAYYIAVHKGLDVDHPRHLTKAITN